jgi:hypothetical protein
MPENPAPAQRPRCEKNGKKSAQFGRFFFSGGPCMVEENFTGKLL